MDSLRKILALFLTGAFLAGLSGCASSNSDLDYDRKVIDTSESDNSYHGWSAPPKETDAPPAQQ